MVATRCPSLERMHLRTRILPEPDSQLEELVEQLGRNHNIPFTMSRHTKREIHDREVRFIRADHSARIVGIGRGFDIYKDNSNADFSQRVCNATGVTYFYKAGQGK
jgi:Phospholipase D-like domain at C-terminus of MIT